jgi:hypothetical protein
MISLEDRDQPSAGLNNFEQETAVCGNMAALGREWMRPCKYLPLNAGIREGDRQLAWIRPWRCILDALSLTKEVRRLRDQLLRLGIRRGEEKAKNEPSADQHRTEDNERENDRKEADESAMWLNE